MIVGLSGYARSGKDESAKVLIDAGFERRAFADTLREFLYRLNPVVGFTITNGDLTSTQNLRVQEVIDAVGWDGYKETGFAPEIRELLQRLGTDCGRQLISDTIWVDAALGPDQIIGEPSIVVPDVRFPNEFEAIQNRGGMVIRIERPGVNPINAHPSETALDGHYRFFDAVITNDGTIEELHEAVVNAVNDYF